MRLGAWILAGLFVGAFAGHFLLADKGYVLVNFRGWVIEMSVPAMVLLLSALYLIIRVVARVWRAPKELGRAVGDRRARSMGDKLTQGLVQMAEGNWAKGERLLTRGLRGSQSPLINYLMAARAAQLQGADQRRDEWLSLAYEELPGAETAILLTQAELQLAHDEHERALANLRKIEERHPNHPLGIALLARLYHRLGDWAGLEKLLPRFGASNLSVEEQQSLATDTVKALFGATDLTRERIEEVIGQLPGEVRKAPGLVSHQADAYARLGFSDKAEALLRGALKRRWDQQLVLSYGRIKGGDAHKQLGRVEKWLKNHPEDEALLLAAARLCMKAELWGKARSYLESSLAIRPHAEAYELYGRLLTRLGEGDEAALAFRSGLALANQMDTRDIPALEAPPEDAGENAGESSS